jgi:hypothetical protein
MGPSKLFGSFSHQQPCAHTSFQAHRQLLTFATRGPRKLVGSVSPTNHGPIQGHQSLLTFAAMGPCKLIGSCSPQQPWAQCHCLEMLPKHAHGFIQIPDISPLKRWRASCGSINEIASCSRIRPQTQLPKCSREASNISLRCHQCTRTCSSL